MSVSTAGIHELGPAAPVVDIDQRMLAAPFGDVLQDGAKKMVELVARGVPSEQARQIVEGGIIRYIDACLAQLTRTVRPEDL